MCFSSWRNSAYATSEAVRRSFRRYKVSADPCERAYRGWDIITSVVELTEMIATAILNARDPDRFAAHQASNEQIEVLFTSLRWIEFAWSFVIPRSSGLSTSSMPVGFGISLQPSLPKRRG